MTKENFFQKAKQDGQVFLKTVNLVTQLSKLKLAVRSKKQEREKILRSIGVALFEIYHADRKLDSTKINNAATEDLRAVEALDAEIKDLEDEMADVKAAFREQQRGGPPPEIDDR